jgi:hydroxymethylpyrimidine/phosphomethylpyrimidine kinase
MRHFLRIGAGAILSRSEMKKPRRQLVCAITIAASDSGGGAGIQADLLTFAAHGVHGGTVLVGVTAQNTRGTSRIARLSAAFIGEQMDAIFPDLRPAAVKIGALLDTPRIRAVAAGLRRHRAKNVVLDPVMVASGGVRLLSVAAVRTLSKEALPLCDLVTPNIPEAEALSGVRIRGSSDRRDAARAIAAFGAGAVLIKGGHARGDSVCDLLYDGRRFREFVNPRIRTRATHGTGCTLSSAIAANLALGHDLEDAVRLAIRYLRGGLRRGYFPGMGWGVPDRIGLEARRASRR